MSIEQTIKHIRQLSYADMVLVSDELAKQLHAAGQPITSRLLADSLSTMSIQGFDYQTAVKQEEGLLREIFSRKRTISVQRIPHGWQVDCGSLSAGTVQGTELRSLFSLLLDQLITLQALTRK